MRRPARTSSIGAASCRSHRISWCVMAADRYSASTRRSHSLWIAATSSSGSRPASAPTQSSNATHASQVRWITEQVVEMPDPIVSADNPWVAVAAGHPADEPRLVVGAGLALDGLDVGAGGRDGRRVARQPDRVPDLVSVAEHLAFDAGELSAVQPNLRCRTWQPLGRELRGAALPHLAVERASAGSA